MIGYIIIGLMIFFVIMEVKNAPTLKEFEETDTKKKEDENNKD